jgi:hypothetical protein
MTSLAQHQTDWYRRPPRNTVVIQASLKKALDPTVYIL